MSVLVIPTSPDTPFYSQVSQLEGVDYGLSFVYNQRENCYYMSINTVAGDALVKGIKMVCNLPLIGFLVTLGLPPGEFLVISSESGNVDPPGLGELGARCQLNYITSDDPNV